jgi:NADH:ubiquinone oxidoreductase subunit 2 (subunit N)
MIWVNRYSDLIKLVETFFPEVLLFVGVCIYLASFFFKFHKNYFYNFNLYFSILFITLISFFCSTKTYNFEQYLISTNLVWLTKLFLLGFVIVFSVVHFFQVRFALILNKQIDIELGSKYFEYNLIVLVLLLSAFFTLMSNDFILFLVGLEIISIGLYILTSLTYERTAVEAALKYFFPGIFFSLIIVLGISFIFWAYGSFNFFEIKNLMYHLDNLASTKVIKLIENKYLFVNHNFTIFQVLFDTSDKINFDLIENLNLNFESSQDYLIFYDYLMFSYFPQMFNNQIITNNNIIIFDFFKELFLQKLKWIFLGFSLIFFGLLGKLGVFPGHFWVLDVYNGTSTLSNFFLSIFPKIVYIFLLIKFRLIFDFLFEYTPINLIFLVSGLLSIWYGLSITLNQWRVKRFLAGSSIVNLGFIITFLGLDTNFFYIISDNIITNKHVDMFLTFEGNMFLQLTIIYFNILIYFITMSIFFYFYLLLRMPKRIKETYYIEDLRELSFLKRTNFILLIVFSLIFFSLAGIPPLSGFFSKFLIFDFLYLNKYYFLLIFLLISSIFALFYYIRIVRHLFFTNADNSKVFIFEDDFIYYLFLSLSFSFFITIVCNFDFFVCVLFDFLIKDLIFLIYF